jgi:hypothetical protein
MISDGLFGFTEREISGRSEAVRTNFQEMTATDSAGKARAPRDRVPFLLAVMAPKCILTVF